MTDSSSVIKLLVEAKPSDVLSSSFPLLLLEIGLVELTDVVAVSSKDISVGAN